CVNKSLNWKSLLVTVSMNVPQPETSASGASMPNHRQRWAKPIRFRPCRTADLPFPSRLDRLASGQRTPRVRTACAVRRQLPTWSNRGGFYSQTTLRLQEEIRRGAGQRVWRRIDQRLGIHEW